MSSTCLSAVECGEVGPGGVAAVWGGDACDKSGLIGASVCAVSEMIGGHCASQVFGQGPVISQ